MQRIVTGCVLAGEPTFILTSLRDGINAARHPHGHVVSVEKACWNLRVRPKGHALARVLCLCCYRNFVIPWTCRYDDRLPAKEDGGEFPFAAHDEWQKTTVEVFGTKESRYAWVDGHGNWWAKPLTPGEKHHWDVYLSPEAKKKYTLGQINVVAWGAPKDEGVPGTIHHVPRKKRGRLTSS